MSQPLPLSEAVERALQRVVRAREIDGDLLGISSGFPTLDEVTLGWQEQDLIIIAARPSMGKTAFALDAAKAAARAGVKSLSHHWKCPRSSWPCACSQAKVELMEGR